MELTTLGATGLEVSRLGLGLAALGRPGYINLGHAKDLQGRLSVDEMEVHAHEVLDAAWERGVRYFDAARSYGRAEDFLASWLAGRKIAPGQATVGSKWGYVYTADWRVDADVHEVKDHSARNLRRQIRESGDRLGAHLAVYQIHSAAPESGVLEDAEVLDELARLRADGLRIGFSVSGPSQAQTVRRAMEITRDGTPLFSSVQATWNLLERSAGHALAEASAAGLGVIVKEALANGRLTDRNPRGLASGLAPLGGIAARVHAEVAELALAAVLAQPWADVVLSGAALPEQLVSNERALGMARDGLPEELMSIVQPSEPASYWAERSALPWT